MTSGLGMLHPSTNCRGGGRSLGSPFGAPALTQATIVSICAWSQRAVVLKLFRVTILKPGRHLPLLHHLLHQLRPRPGIFVGQQRERRALAGAVASLAILLHDGRNIFRERDVGCARKPGWTRSSRPAAGWNDLPSPASGQTQTPSHTIAERGLKLAFSSPSFTLALLGRKGILNQM